MPDLFNLPDGYLSFEGNAARGKRSLQREDGKFYARVFGLDWLPEEMLWANGRPTLLNREKKYEIILEDGLGGEFNFNYWFPELEFLNGGTALANHQPKKPSRAKKVIAVLTVIGIGAAFLNLPAHLDKNSSNNSSSSNSTNCIEAEKNIYTCHAALLGGQNLSNKLADQLDNCSAILLASENSLKNCGAQLTNLTSQIAQTSAQLDQTTAELEQCQLDYSNLSTKVKQISELVSQ